MKKRANLITRVALAATIFVTTLAGVAPMTAMAANDKTTATVSYATSENEATARDVTITFNYNGGEYTTPPADVTATMAWDTEYDLPSGMTKAPTKEYSYTFNNWTITGAEPATVNEGGKIKNFSATSVTAVANWNETENTNYELTYDLRGGTLASGIQNPTKYYESDLPASVTATATREGFTFKGFGLSATDNNPVSSIRNNSFDTSNKLTLYAIWEENAASTDPTPTKPASPSIEVAGASITSDGTYVSNTDTVAFLLSGLTSDELRAGAAYYYTIDGSNPTTTSTKSASGSFSCAASGSSKETITVKAIAVRNGLISDPSSVTVTLNNNASSNTTTNVAAPTFSIANNSTYTLGDPIYISTTTPGATIKYSFDDALDRNYNSRGISLSNSSYVGETYTLKAVAIVNGVTSDTSSVTFTVAAASSPTTYDGTIALDPASVSKGSETNVYIKATPKTSGGVNTITGVVDANGRTPAGIYGLGTSEVRLAGSYVKGLTENTKLTVTMSDGSTKEVTLNLGAASGEAKKLSSIQWASNGNDANLGTSFTDEGGRHPAATGDNPSVPTIIYLVGGTKEFPNGTTKEKIEAELKTSDSINVTLEGLSAHNRTVTWDYSYTHAIDNNKRYSAYNNDKTDAQYFTLYSKPIAFSNANSDGTFPYSVDGHNYFRLKIEVKVLEAGASTNTSSGSNPPTNLTFTPGEGTYVTPGSLITFSATASSGTVSYRATSGNTTPTTTNGADGARGVTIPSGTNAGDYKMNVIAYTSSSNTTTRSATFKVVTNNKYNVTYDNGVLTCDGNLSDFKGLWIQGTSNYFEFVPATNYTTASGSTIVTLTPTYLNSQTGSKVVRMVYTDGYAEGSFTLTAGATNAVTPLTDLTTTPSSSSGSASSGGGRSGVGTDDRSELVIMFVLLGMLIAGFVVSVYYKNEKLRRYRD